MLLEINGEWLDTKSDRYRWRLFKTIRLLAAQQYHHNLVLDEIAIGEVLCHNYKYIKGSPRINQLSANLQKILAHVTPAAAKLYLPITPSLTDRWIDLLGRENNPAFLEDLLLFHTATLILETFCLFFGGLGTPIISSSDFWIK